MQSACRKPEDLLASRVAINGCEINRDLRQTLETSKSVFRLMSVEVNLNLKFSVFSFQCSVKWWDGRCRCNLMPSRARSGSQPCRGSSACFQIPCGPRPAGWAHFAQRVRGGEGACSNYCSFTSAPCAGHRTARQMSRHGQEFGYARPAENG